MPTLSVLHNYLIRDDDVVDAIVTMPGWELIRSSGSKGETRPYFLATSARGTKVMFDWPDQFVQQFHSAWEHMRLVSVELSQQRYDEVLTAIQSKAVLKTSEVVDRR